MLSLVTIVYLTDAKYNKITSTTKNLPIFGVSEVAVYI